MKIKYLNKCVSNTRYVRRIVVNIVIVFNGEGGRSKVDHRDGRPNEHSTTIFRTWQQTATAESDGRGRSKEVRHILKNRWVRPPMTPWHIGTPFAPPPHPYQWFNHSFSYVKSSSLCGGFFSFFFFFFPPNYYYFIGNFLLLCTKILFIIKLLYRI